MKTSTENSATKKSLEVRFIRNIEQLGDSDLRLVLRDKVPAHTIGTVNWSDFPYAPKVEFRVAHSDDAIVVMFDVEESHVRAVAMENNGAVWEDSCVEFFVGNPVGEGYFNFEINCVGTALAAFRRSRDDADHFDDEKMARVRRFGSLKHEPIDSRGEGQKWWMAEVIPFSLLGLEKAPKTLRANFYKCGDKCDQTHFLSWSPIALEKPNFHCPDFFGELKLL
ncbi:MAG: hypothetical protein IKY82_00055 [Alistipes sp.]|nr:hypothetical protein [Alistipes sp.]